MSTTAALLEGHYIMTVATPGERHASCQCGTEFEWDDRDKAHALHLLDVVRADHEKAVRERIVRAIEARANQEERKDYTPHSSGVFDGLVYAARIVREGA